METAVFLTDEEARKFILFQKHHNLFDILDKEKVFEMQFGKCILNIAFGELQNIVKESVVYKK